MCSEALLIFLVCTFLCFIFLMHYISFACSVFALGLQSTVFSRTQDIASLTLKNELGTPKKFSSFGTRINL